MSIFKAPECFISEPLSEVIPVIALRNSDFDGWMADQDDLVKTQIMQAGFTAHGGSVLLVRGSDGALRSVLAGVSDVLNVYEISAAAEAVHKGLHADVLSQISFDLRLFDGMDAENAYLGWALGCYQFDMYKSVDKPVPRLVVKGLDRVGVLASAVYGLRDLVNIPANDLGPAELEDAAAHLARQHKAKIKTVRGKALEKGFPLVKAVGQGAIKEREPRLIDISWGDKSHPMLCVVGKGVCYDTGGLDIKPSQHMAIMKKDMGGAAHALALAHVIMSLGLPVQLRVIIPAVENAVDGNSFRTGDVFPSRSGRTVENKNTDAEGRLILADALTYAGEFDPDLIIDFATLTGSARAALGMDVPAGFSNDSALEEKMRNITGEAQDLIWPMPLYTDYYPLMDDAGIADIVNAFNVPGDLIYSALFLQSFVGRGDDAPRWMHVDCYAWELAGRPGRKKGGKDTGLRGMYALLEDLYSV